jgi:hypothetical protein
MRVDCSLASRRYFDDFGIGMLRRQSYRRGLNGGLTIVEAGPQFLLP